MEMLSGVRIVLQEHSQNHLILSCFHVTLATKSSYKDSVLPKILTFCAIT